MGPHQTHPGAYRHPKGDACIEMGDITRHQLELSFLGVSLRSRTREAGQSARQGVGDIYGRLVDHGLGPRRGDDDSRGRQNKQPCDHADAHD